jgi:hypothetical protein
MATMFLLKVMEKIFSWLGGQGTRSEYRNEFVKLRTNSRKELLHHHLLMSCINRTFPWLPLQLHSQMGRSPCLSMWPAEPRKISSQEPGSLSSLEAKDTFWHFLSHTVQIGNDQPEAGSAFPLWDTKAKEAYSFRYQSVLLPQESFSVLWR